MNARILSLQASYIRSLALALVLGSWAWPTSTMYGQEWPESYRGVWSATIFQGNSNYPYYICLLGGVPGQTVGSLTVRGLNPVDVYGFPNWNTGIYTLTETGDASVIVQEIILDGNKASSDGPVQLDPLSNDQMRYKWLPANPPAESTFTRISALTDSLPDAYRSIWEGSILKDAETRRVRLTLAGGDLGSPIGVVDYPDSGGGCGGLVTLESVNVDDGTICLSEVIDYGTCAWTEAHFSLSNATLTTLDIKWDGPNGALAGQLTDTSGFLLRPTASIELAGPDAQGKVQLNAAKSTTPAGTEPLTFTWELGDDTSSTDAATEHTYASGVYSIRLTVANAAGWSAQATTSVVVPCATSNVLPWTSTDLGTPLVPGGARREDPAAASCLTVCAAGRGFQGSADEGHFLFQEVEGDFVLTTDIKDLRNAPDSSQAGLMVRESDNASDPSARQGSLLVLGNGNIAALRRAMPNGATNQKKTTDAGDRWLRLERRGNAVLGFHSPDGAQWTPLDDPLLDGISASKVFVGLVASPRRTATESFYPAMDARFCEPQLERSISGPSFRRSDTNADGKVDISDAVATLGFLFLGNPTQLPCDKSADADDSGDLNLTDAVSLLNHLFLGAMAPPAPFEACGVDPTQDELSCDAFEPCA